LTATCGSKKKHELVEINLEVKGRYRHSTVWGSR
jgi:hypothetical protein